MAQPALKLVTVDVARAYSSYWKSKENDQKLRVRETTAKDVLGGLEQERNILIEEFNAFKEKVENNMLSEAARLQARTDAEQKAGQVQEKEAQMNQYIQNTQRQIQQTQMNQRELVLEDIEKAVLEINKTKGGTLVIDISGRTANGIPAVLVADPAYDITDEVIVELNKTQPADFKE